MLKMGYFDPVERRHEKARGRAADDDALRNAQVSRANLRARNSFLSPLDIISSSSEHQSSYL